MEFRLFQNEYCCSMKLLQYIWIHEIRQPASRFDDSMKLNFILNCFVFWFFIYKVTIILSSLTRFGSRKIMWCSLNLWLALPLLMASIDNLPFQVILIFDPWAKLLNVKLTKVDLTYRIKLQAYIRHLHSVEIDIRHIVI